MGDAYSGRVSGLIKGFQASTDGFRDISPALDNQILDQKMEEDLETMIVEWI